MAADNSALTAADRVQTGLDAVATAADRVQTGLDRAAAEAAAAAASGSAAFLDTNPIVKGSGDATKQVRLEVDGLTAGTTRVLTVPDEDMTLAGRGANSFGDTQQSRAMFKDCGYVFVDKGNSGATTQTLDYTAGSHQKITVTGAHTIATSNWPPTGNLGEMLLELVNGAAFAVTWPTINWIKSDGSTTTTFSSNGMTLQSAGTDFVLLWTSNGGTAIYGKVIR